MQLSTLIQLFFLSASAFVSQTHIQCHHAHHYALPDASTTMVYISTFPCRRSLSTTTPHQQHARSTITDCSLHQILLLTTIRPLAVRFLPYGSRLVPPPTQPTTRLTYRPPRRLALDPPLPPSVLTLLDRLAALTVPHAYFTHFYLLSLALSLLTILTLLTHPAPLAPLLTPPPNPTISPQQLVLTLTALLAQSARRAYESLTLTPARLKPPRLRTKEATRPPSRMWVGHWALGLAFYALIHPAAWLHASPALLARPVPAAAALAPPTWRTLLALPVFLLASGAQHDVHAYLARLEKYRQPVHPLFRACVCPHYLCEVLIYTSLAVLAAPRGGWGVNPTLGAAGVFVAVNLGVTAQGTREWWGVQFGEQSIEGKAAMVPGLF